MPIYEYECRNCGTRFEKMQPITSDPVKICPNCGEEQVRRVFQPVGVIFKGSGWYITDNRKNNNSSSKQSDKPASAEKTEAKSESTSSESSSGTASPASSSE